MSTKEPILRNALKTAVAAALEAGKILRAEFHRPGGPRGQGYFAEIDGEAERFIREKLTGAFPEWGYVGEETGAGRFPHGMPYWAVDPNDGTSSFLKGWRGPSVSIGLVRGGVPVLGVVYAFSAPDDRGDLFSWAEGEQLLRNGAPQPQIRDEIPGRGTVLLHSLTARRDLSGNLFLSQPGRVRLLPSVAYRLALVAAGEGNLAISLNAVATWDVAAGHALLLGAGGGLWNDEGYPVRYDADGRMIPGGYVFGGGKAAAHAFCRKKWDKPASSGKTSPPRKNAPIAPVGPLKDRHAGDPGPLSRAHGCLLGLIAGDALGSLVEYMDPGKIAAFYKDGGPRDLSDGGTWNTIAGQPSDDAEQALLLSRAIVAAKGYDEEEAARHYAWWLDSKPFDIESATAIALSGAARARTGRLSEAARTSARPDSQANGALARVGPLGILAWRLPAASAAELGSRDASLTHPHPVCRAASAALTVAAAAAIRTGDRERAYRAALEWSRKNAPPEVAAALEAAPKRLPDDYRTRKGWVLIALQNAFNALLGARTPADGIVGTVRRGGDTGTNGAVCGALLGAVLGRDALPLAWRRAILSCRPLAGLPGVRRPRPEAVWPVDALELAEHLLLLGD